MQNKCYYTEIPNDFIEKSAFLSSNAFRLYTIICRKTIGFHRESDTISSSQLMQMCGMHSKRYFLRAREELLKCGLILIKHKGNGRGNKTIYAIIKGGELAPH